MTIQGDGARGIALSRDTSALAFRLFDVTATGALNLQNATVENGLAQGGVGAGGKAASTRGRSGRIEEHGLHVWLGYYDNAFALLRECYEELDRSATDPACPIRTWRDAFVPSEVIGVAYSPLTDKWRLAAGDLDVNYMMCFERD